MEPVRLGFTGFHPAPKSLLKSFPNGSDVATCSFLT